jgi:hypothetical protein
LRLIRPVRRRGETLRWPLSGVLDQPRKQRTRQFLRIVRQNPG